METRGWAQWLSVSAIFLSCQAVPVDAPPGARQSALAPPAPGDSVTIEFETDAAGNPLPRGTILGEQYAALGVHFHNGYIIGDRATDFADYVAAPTPDNFVCTRASGVPGGCGATQDRPPVGTPFEITLDFPACYVSIVGRSGATTATGLLGVVGYDASGYKTGSGASSDILSVVRLDMPLPPYVLLHEGVGTASIPNAFNRVPTTPAQGLDMRRIDIDGPNVDSFDSLKITRCVGLQPKCKPQLICTSAAQQCVAATDVNVDNGSFDASNDLPVTVSQAPAAPYPLGTTPVTLTVAQGAETATCAAAVTVGDCAAPTLTCPPPVVKACAAGPSGCSSYQVQATATDSCQTREVAGSNGCLLPGENTLKYTASSISGATSTCSTTVTITDTVPPVITGDGTQIEGYQALSVVDGELHNVVLDECAIVVSDACDNQVDKGWPSTKITCASSDEDGLCVQSSDDIQVLNGGVSVELRAKNDAGGAARVYAVHFDSTDGSGNKASGACTFVVPGNAGQGGGGAGGAGGAGAGACGGVGGAAAGGGGGAPGTAGSPGGAGGARGGNAGNGGAPGASAGGANAGGAGGRVTGGDHGPGGAGNDDRPPGRAGCSAAGGAPVAPGWLTLALGALFATRTLRRRGPARVSSSSAGP